VAWRLAPTRLAAGTAEEEPASVDATAGACGVWATACVETAGDSAARRGIAAGTEAAAATAVGDGSTRARVVAACGVEVEGLSGAVAGTFGPWATDSVGVVCRAAEVARAVGSPVAPLDATATALG